MTITTGEAHAEERGQPERGPVPADTFAARLMLARMHAGYITIQDAAERCGLTNQSWSNWERGMRPRDLLEIVRAISEGLGVDRNWLLFGGPLATERRDAPRRRRAAINGLYPIWAGPSRPSGSGIRATRRDFPSPAPSPARPSGRVDPRRPLSRRPAGYPTPPLGRAA